MPRNPLNPFRAGLTGDRDLGGDPFLALHREMNRLFDDALRGGLGAWPPRDNLAGAAARESPGGGSLRQGQGGPGGVLMPHMDVSETETELKVCAELPGVSENDVEVTLEDDVLTIRGEKRFERKDDKENYHFIERSYGTFQRALRIPYPVNPDEVGARFDNGVLTVTIPKAPAPERSRRIQVQTGGQGSGQARGGQAARTRDQATSGKGRQEG
jgi:HSP20 family protein